MHTWLYLIVISGEGLQTVTEPATFSICHYFGYLTCIFHYDKSDYQFD
jgi:hypothetical protein